MTTLLRADSASQLFREAVELILAHGVSVRPRGKPTHEVLGAHLELTHPRSRVVHLPPVRCLNAAFAAAESAWILSGSDDPWIYAYNDRLREFADDGVLRGAYGPRMRRWGSAGLDQLHRAVQTLRDDPDSRRAVIQLYDPAVDGAGHRDVPCTLGYRFHLRDGFVHMSTTMRSQDVWLGLPYDIYSATVLHELVAGWLGAGLGTYSHHVDSLHLYDSDLPRVADGLPDVGDGDEMAALSVPWEGFDGLLADVIAGVPTGHVGWDTVMSAMSSYRRWKSGDRGAAGDAARRVEGPLGESLRAWYETLAGGRPSAIATAQP